MGTGCPYSCKVVQLPVTRIANVLPCQIKGFSPGGSLRRSRGLGPSLDPFEERTAPSLLHASLLSKAPAEHVSQGCHIEGAHMRGSDP